MSQDETGHVYMSVRKLNDLNKSMVLLRTKLKNNSDNINIVSSLYSNSENDYAIHFSIADFVKDIQSTVVA